MDEASHVDEILARVINELALLPTSTDLVRSQRHTKIR